MPHTDGLLGRVSAHQPKGGAKVACRVFIVCHNPLFGQGVERLLCQEGGVEILALERQPARAFERIRELMPDVVILDCADQRDRLPERMLQAWTDLGIKLIGLSLVDNAMHIYHTEHREIRSATDLVTAVLEQSRH